MRGTSFCWVTVMVLAASGGSLAGASATEPVAFAVDEYELREIAVAGGAIWVVGFQTVVRLDQATGAVTDTIELPGARGIAATDAAVWVGSTDGAIVRIDPQTRQVVAEVPTGRVSVEGVAADEVSAWLVSDDDGMLFAIDAATNEVVREIPIVGRFPQVAVGTTAVWVSPGTSGASQLQRVDRVSGEVTAVEVGERLSAVASAGAVAWVVSDDNNVCRVDDSTGDVTCVGLGIDEFDQEIASLAYGDGTLWAAVQGDAINGEGYAAIALDADSLEAVAEVAIPVGDLSIFDIAAGVGAAYVSNDLGDSSSIIVVSI